MWASIAYRRAQALMLLALSALITACAVFAPLYERSLEQSLLRDGLTRQSLTETAVVASSVVSRDAPPSSTAMRSTFPAALGGLYDAGSDMWSDRLHYTGVARQQSTVDIRGPQDVCRGLRLAQGTCPARAYDVAVSTAEAKVQGWQVGTRLQAVESQPGVSAPAAFPQPFVVTGLFEQLDDPGHWMGVSLVGRAGTATLDPTSTPLMDGWVTVPATFTGWKNPRLDITWLLDRDAVTLDRLDGIPSAVDTMRATGQTKVPTVAVRSAVSDLVSSVVEGQRQARTIVPLLVGQLAVLAAVVLGLAVGAAVEQRRPELALARLRGQGPGGAGRAVMLELGVVVAAGVPVGFALALLTNEVARRVWLAAGVPFEVPSASWVAALLALLAALGAVALVARPTLGEPISTLLRRVPPRRPGWAVGAGDTIVVALAAAGVVTLASGNLAGPLALATPTLLALALGLVLAHVLVPVANVLGRRLTRRGRLVGALTAVNVARRPAVRRIVAIITVATALTVFATDAIVIGARNRDDRARVETGAEAVLTTDASDVTVLRDAVRAVDPGGTFATPVVTVRQGSSTAMTTLAVDPGPFSRIAELPRDRGAFPWSAISGTPPADVLLTGRSLSVTAAPAALVVADPPVAPGTPGSPAAAGSPGSATPPPPTLVAYLAPSGNAPFAVPLGELTAGTTAPTTFTRDVSCAAGCRLAGFGLTTSMGFSGLVTGTVVLGPVAVDGAAPARLGATGMWVASGTADPTQRRPFAQPVDAGDTTRIGMQVQTFGDDVRISSAGIAASVSALVLGPLPSDGPGPAFQAAGLDGTTIDLSRVGSVPYAPGGGTNEAIVSLEALARRANQISPQASAQVYVADAAKVPEVQSRLRQAGVTVRTVALRTDRAQLFDSSASAWGLRLALVVGLAALAIAALVLVLVAATSWRGRSRDFAALRMAGVSARSLTRVSLAEQWVVVVVSVAAGAVCGLLGAWLAMPIVPFFTLPSAVLPIDLTPAAGPALLTAAAALVALLLVGLVVGAQLVGRASMARVRDQL